MRSEIIQNKEFYIISRDIDNAEKCRIIAVYKDCFKVKLNKARKYEVDEVVELFTMTELGQLYFETIIKEVNGEDLLIWYPISSKYLQRREFTRINSPETINLTEQNNKIEAEILDISAGGLKVSTKKPLELLKDYNINLNIENKEMKAIFQPIRIEYGNKIFVSSGKFKDMSNQDRITLVQYCFRKQIENTSL